ncbi:hypothetical protein PROPEN_03293 [Proteus penneri ATCC 35198]|nr:hypothetical protein PROPEN_03293 [Proteus penneri ATCC 35198]
MHMGYYINNLKQNGLHCLNNMISRKGKQLNVFLPMLWIVFVIHNR